MKQAILSLENVSKFYTSATNVVVGLNGVSARFCRGEFVAITGESGSGKSTLSAVLGGILPYESGEVFFAGKPTSHYDGGDWERYRRDQISYISQSYGILPGATVLSNVVSALRLAGMDKKQARLRAQEILVQVELWELRRRRAARLSSGQKQRLSIARALAKPAPILIADEPTGNLDPENSAKVISLLAQAAQTRLVLLVTHEFDEVRGYATRHIRMQDGRVVTDTVLRPANDPVPGAAQSPKKSGAMSLYVSALQMRSRPVWTVLMTLLFALTAFAVFAFLGTFIIALDDTNTRIYDDTAFRNGSITRLVVSSKTLQPLTQADYEAILGVKYVTELEKNGYVSDVQYSYREGVDYTVSYRDVISGGFIGSPYETTYDYQVRSTSPFIRTVPMLQPGVTFLKEGSLPENFYEVVAHSADGLKIGDRVKVFLTDSFHWGWENLELTFTVVGLTDYGSGLYFSDRVGSFFQQVAHTGSDSRYYQFIPEITLENQEAIEDQISEDYVYSLEDGQCRIHENIWIANKTESPKKVLAMQFANVNLIREGLDPFHKDNRVTLYTPEEQHWAVDVQDWTIDGDEQASQLMLIEPHIHQMGRFTRLVQVNQNTYDQLTWQLASEQVSITVADYAYADRVMEALADMGYIAVSPFRLGSTEIDPEKAEQRMQTLTVCLAALAAVVALQVVLLRAMFSAQTQSYQLLSNIGLVGKTARKSVLWQFLCFTVLGQLLGGGCILLAARLGIERIANLTRYLPPENIAILCTVHLIGALVAAAWSIRAMTRAVYPMADKFADLELEEKEAVV